MTSPRTFDRSQLATWLIDVGAIVAMLALVGLAFVPIYGHGWLWMSIFGGGVVGLAIAFMGHLRRWNTGYVALAFLVAWFFLGPLLAMPSSALWGFLPTPRTLRGLAIAPVTAWKDMLMFQLPIGETFNLLAVPLMVSMVGSLASGTIALRSRHPSLAWLPLGVGMLVAWAVGANYSIQPLLVALAAALLVIVWTSYRSARARSRLLSQQTFVRWPALVMSLVILTCASLATLGLSGVMQPSKARATLRQVVEPPLDLRNYASPLQGMRANITQQLNSTIVEVAGLPDDAVIRLATLDVYDGMTYNVANSDTLYSGSGEFRRVGRRIVPEHRGSMAHVTVQVGEFDQVWVPTVGYLTSIDFTSDRKVALTDNFYFNRSSGTGIVPIGLAPGDSYTMTSLVPDRPSDHVIAQLDAAHDEAPRSDEVPDALRELAAAWTTGAATKGEAAIKLQERLRQGFYSRGQSDEVPSAPGHNYDRIERFIAQPDLLTGDEEQYAVTMALMARELGIPARVVYGYQAPDGGNGSVTGDDVRAWPELKFKTLGWVLFNPTPSHDRTLVDEQTPNPPPPNPRVDNPPPPPKKPEKHPPDTKLEPQEASDPDEGIDIDWSRVGRMTALIGIPIITLIGPPVLIIGLKARRRSQRRKNPTVANRVAGAWSELVDRSRDLGTSPSPSGTRTEQAETMVVAFPHMLEESDPIGLAKQADVTVFSPDPVSAERADAYWQATEAADRGMRGSVGWHRRLWARLSTRSFRKYR